VAQGDTQEDGDEDGGTQKDGVEDGGTSVLYHAMEVDEKEFPRPPQGIIFSIYYFDLTSVMSIFVY
jgi:hypothetical protein